MFRRLAAEDIGSLLLAATVIGSGVMAERLSAGSMAVALLANTAATVAILAVLIALLGPIIGQPGGETESRSTKFGSKTRCRTSRFSWW